MGRAGRSGVAVSLSANHGESAQSLHWIRGKSL